MIYRALNSGLIEILLAVKTPNETAEAVRNSMIRMFSKIPAEKIRSITPDRGHEFAKYAEVSDGKDLAGVRESDMAAFRRDHLGFVFQEFNLLDTFSLKDNICLPLVLAGKSWREMEQRLLPLTQRLGIDQLLAKYPYEVSGGQKQRAAVARALITEPRILLADEPTGALDSRATDELLDLFGQINAAGQTILMVTHSVRAASRAGRVLFIKDGRVFHQIYRGEATSEQLYQKISDTLTMLQGGERA